MLTVEQKRLRQTGITGSEVGALVGLSRFSSPIDVYRSKVELVVDEELGEMSPDQVRGHLYEGPTRDWYALRERRFLVPCTTIKHAEHPLVIATPDSLSYADEDRTEDARVVEIKVPRRHGGRWGEPGTSDIDSAYYPQVLWEMAVTGTKSCDVVVLLYGDLAVYNVPFNEEMYENLRYVAEKFWRDYIVPRRPPPPDASDGYREYLSAEYPVDREPPLLADSETEEALDELLAVRANIAVLAEKEALLVNTIKAKVGDAGGIRSPRVEVTWRANRPTNRVNFKAIIAEANVPSELILKYTAPGKPARPFCVKALDAKE